MKLLGQAIFKLFGFCIFALKVTLIGAFVLVALMLLMPENALTVVEIFGGFLK